MEEEESHESTGEEPEQEGGRRRKRKRKEKKRKEERKKEYKSATHTKHTAQIAKHNSTTADTVDVLGLPQHGQDGDGDVSKGPGRHDVLNQVQEGCR